MPEESTDKLLEERQERKDIYDAVSKDLDARSDWEERQNLWYEMRHDGVPRSALPWVGAADLHHPLADQKIEEQKPKYYGQIFSQQHVAFFATDNEELAVMCREDEKTFDYKLKKKSNLQEEILTAIDYHLERGFCFVKGIWENDEIRFDAIEPLMIILPKYAKSLEEIDRLVHVIQMPLWMYKERKDFNQEEEFVSNITGGEEWLKNDSSQQQKTKEYREGFQGSSEEDLVVVWETWTKNGKKWNVEYISPQFLDKPIKKKMASPFKSGRHPFIYLPREIKDKGIYASRGIPEMVAAEEAVCNKILNEMMDRFTLSIRPYLVPTMPMPNTQNFDFAAGGTAPFPVTALQIPPPPLDPLVLIQDSTARAEKRIGVFNMALGGGGNNKEGNEFPTKYQMQLMAGQQGESIDLRARVFRMFLTELYKLSLELYHENDKKDFKLIGKDYDVIPSGSPDGLTKEVLERKAFTRLQKYNGDPFIDQKRLREDDLEQDDPRLVDRLLIEPENLQNDQAEEQGKEILLLEQLFPVAAKPTDDHKVHLTTMIQREQMLVAKRAKQDPDTMNRKMEHAVTHLGYMKQQKDPEFKIYKDMVTNIFQPQNGAQQKVPA